ncbi:MAG TPA: chorismate mutase [Savagea sp.]
MVTRGIRGATTVEEDREELVLQATESLIIEMVEQNDVEIDDIASVIVSTTTDVTSVFPARAIRSIEGWEYVPVMCTHEMDVPGAIQKCIRLMMHVNTNKAQREIEHIYQNEAVRLRPDLVKEEK